jgi:hypothetical protein
MLEMSQAAKVDKPELDASGLIEVGGSDAFDWRLTVFSQIMMLC